MPTSCLKGRPVPDQGWCWVMFFSTSVNMFLVFGVHYTYGILYPSLLKEFSRGQGKTAWVGSLASGLLFLSSALAIKCCDKLSVTATSIMGAILSGTGLILTSLIKEFYWLYLVYGVLFGVGSSFLYTPGLIMIAKWFKKYQSITTGVATAFAALGAVVLSPLIQYVISVSGLRYTIRSAGIMYISAAIICSVSYRRLESVGAPDNNLEVHHTDTRELVEVDVERKDEKKDGGRSFRINFKLFRRKSYMMYVLIEMMTNFTYYIPIIHLVNYAETYIDVSPTSSSLLISIWSISNIVGRALFGKLASLAIVRPRLLRLYQVCMFFSGVVTLSTYFATTYWMLIGYVVCYGFLDGSFIGLLSLVTLDIVGMDDMAQGFGIMLTSIGVPIALGPYLIGVINDTKVLPAKFMFVMAGAPFVIGSFLMSFVIKWKNQEASSPLQGQENEEEIDATDTAFLSHDKSENLEFVTAL